ncbi:hypothetical protein ACHBTE_34675 [Streptomyces sp. M41]|uniref:hypothetical protein n=1 Tax=Streptomyces sp. M41 TaxID=3059412 RepID=UPI00374D3B44
MSNASTTQPLSEAQEAAGHGRHRGPVSASDVSASDSETAPRGRHRKPVEETETAA